MSFDIRHGHFFAGKREFTTGARSSASLPYDRQCLRLLAFAVCARATNPNYDRTLANRYAPLKPKIRLGDQAATAGVS
jgi:hypothetical protein